MKKNFASRPKKMAEVMSELMARRGYARVQAAAGYEQAWRQAAGDMIAGSTRVGTVRRGALEVIVANSTMLQELTFQKHAILDQLKSLLPQERIGSLRLRVGPIE